MTDDESMALAVHASPEDRTLRLVYADLLDEQNDPRADFLRLQCQVVTAIQQLSLIRLRVQDDWISQIDLFGHAFVVSRVPFLGESIGHVSVKRLLVRVGCRVQKGEAFLAVETDKAVFDLHVEIDGVLVMMLVEIEQSVPIGGALALFLKA